MKNQNEDKDKTLFQISVEDNNQFGKIAFYIKEDIDRDEAIYKLKALGNLLSSYSEEIIDDHLSRKTGENRLSKDRAYLH